MMTDGVRSVLGRRGFLCHSASLAAAGGLLAACGALAGPGRGRPAAATAEPHVRLTYLHQWSQSQGHGPITDQLVAQFNQQVPTIQVEAVYVAGYYEKVATIIAGGDLPDVLTYNLAFLPRLVRQQVIVPLETLAKGTPRLNLSDLVPAGREMGAFDGKLMAVPYVLNSTGLAYNQTLFQQKGVDPHRPPAVWQDLVELGRRLTGGSGDDETWGMLFPRGTADPISPLLAFLWQNGGEPVDMARRVATWHSQAGADALQFQVDLVHKHRIAPLQAAGNPERAGRIGVWLIPPGNVSVLKQAVGDQFAWATAALPRGKQPATSVGGHSLVIMKTNRHHERAWRFIHWYTQAPQLAAYLIASTTLPPWRAVEQQPAWQQYVRDEPRIKPFVEMLAHGRPTPKLTTWQDITDLLVQAREAAVKQERTVKEALDNAARLAEPLIKEG